MEKNITQYGPIGPIGPTSPPISASNLISILTTSQLKRNNTLQILFDIIKNQTYKNIYEWIIVEGSQSKGDAIINEKLIKNNIIERDDYNFIIKYIPYTKKVNLGNLRNKGNDMAKGDIIIWMDDDDFYFNTYVEHCYETLNNSNLLIAGSTNIYVHDLVLEKNIQLNFKNIVSNYMSNNVMAYKKEYLILHRYNNEDKSNEEQAFTHNFTEKYEELNPDKSIIHLLHSYNTFNKRRGILDSTFKRAIGWEPCTIDLVSLIPAKYLEKYKKHLIDTTPSTYDISYLTGGLTIIWSPTDMKLGGSEQAIVNLSNNWAKLGKKVAVYGNFENEISINGVDYLFWYKFPFEKNLNTVILWRASGLILGLFYKIKAKTLVVDFHDKFSEMVFYNLNKVNLLGNMFDRVHKINFKSNYHLESFEEFIGHKLAIEKYNIILNGVRVDAFSNNNLTTHSNFRNPYRFCYCSCYTRGLETILEKLWHIIYKNEPRATLHVYYGMERIQDVNYKEKMLRLLSQPGVTDHGRQPMDAIIKEKYLSTFQLYLSVDPQEIDCISIRESLVTGCIPIISNFGVFKERDGIHYDWDPSCDNLIKNVGDDICLKMKDKKLISEYSIEMTKSKTIVDWSVISQKWLDTL